MFVPSTIPCGYREPLTRNTKPLYPYREIISKTLLQSAYAVSISNEGRECISNEVDKVSCQVLKYNQSKDTDTLYRLTACKEEFDKLEKEIEAKSNSYEVDRKRCLSGHSNAGIEYKKVLEEIVMDLSLFQEKPIKLLHFITDQEQAEKIKEILCRIWQLNTECYIRKKELEKYITP